MRFFRKLFVCVACSLTLELVTGCSPRFPPVAARLSDSGYAEILVKLCNRAVGSVAVEIKKDGVTYHWKASKTTSGKGTRRFEIASDVPGYIVTYSGPKLTDPELSYELVSLTAVSGSNLLATEPVPWKASALKTDRVTDVDGVTHSSPGWERAGGSLKCA